MDDLHKLLYNYHLKLYIYLCLGADVASHKSKEIQWNKFLIPK